MKIEFFSVGSYPKDMQFTSDCTRLVIANEGPPGLDNPCNATDAKIIDPEGSLTIIVRNDQALAFPVEINMDFTSFNSR